MTFGWLIMLIIIAIAAVVVVMVFIYGTKHDPHTEMRSAESSKAVQTLKQQYDAAMRKMGTPEPATPVDASTDEAETETNAKPMQTVTEAQA